MNKNISFVVYTPKYKKELESLMNAFQDYLVSVDTFGRLARPKNYGKKYVAYLLKKIKKESGVIFLALENSKLVGCTAGVIERAGIGDQLGSKNKITSGRVLELFVYEEFRGQNIGKELLTMLERYFKKHHCKAVHIEVFAPNTHAHQFYLQKGYLNESIDVVKKL